MKQVNKKLLLVGAGVLGTICAIAAIKKWKEKPLEPEFDDWDEDFDEPFFDDDLEDDEEVHVIKRFRVTDEDTIRFLDEAFGCKMEENDE